MGELEFYTDFDYKDFDTYISHLKHRLKAEGAVEFINRYTKEPDIHDIEKKLYLVSLIEFLGNKHKLDMPYWIDKYTNEKMGKMLFSNGAILFFKITGSKYKLEQDYSNSIKEFINHNIVETSVSDVL